MLFFSFSVAILLAATLTVDSKNANFQKVKLARKIAANKNKLKSYAEQTELLFSKLSVKSNENSEKFGLMAKPSLSSATGYIRTEAYIYSDDCSGFSMTVWQAYGVCVESTNGESSLMEVTKDGDSLSATNSIFPNSNCDGAPSKTEYREAELGECMGGSMKILDLVGSFSPQKGAVNRMSYNSLSTCADGDYSDVILAAATPLDMCYPFFMSSSFQYSSCDTLTVFKGNDCDGKENDFELGDDAFTLTCQLGDDSYGDDNYGDDFYGNYYDDNYADDNYSDDFEEIEYVSQLCVNAAVVASRVSAVLVIAAASFMFAYLQ